LREKKAHEPLKKSADRPAAPKNVVNLIDALRRSVTNDIGKPAKKGKKRIAGQGEMLLPITGKKKEEAKEVAKPASRRKAG
jgi:DNA end-binding protein Ku